MAESLSCARRLPRDRMSPFPHRAAGLRGATARSHQAAGVGGEYLLPARGVEIDSPAAPLLPRDSPRRKETPGFRACPTPACTRSTGFGVYGTMERPGAPSHNLRGFPEYASAGQLGVVPRFFTELPLGHGCRPIHEDPLHGFAIGRMPVRRSRARVRECPPDHGRISGERGIRVRLLRGMSELLGRRTRWRRTPRGLRRRATLLPNHDADAHPGTNCARRSCLQAPSSWTSIR
jgi:hypothetical protein